MAETSSRVTYVETETDDLGLVVRVTVRRTPPQTFYGAIMPRVGDVPSDIRDALLAWLEGDR